MLPSPSWPLSPRHRAFPRHISRSRSVCRSPNTNQTSISPPSSSLSPSPSRLPQAIMKQSSKDPFEVAYEEEQDSHLESPIAGDDIMIDAPATTTADDEILTKPHTSTLKRKLNQSTSNSTTAGKGKEEEEEEEEENMDMELGKLPSTGDPDKMAKMQAILSQFTEEQMSRYESFRRSGFQKANMKKSPIFHRSRWCSNSEKFWSYYSEIKSLLASITGSPKISVPMTIVVSGIAKMFVGELIETGRIVMNERRETGPIRPCHIREAYRRLKLEGKVPKRSVSRLFR